MMEENEKQATSNEPQETTPLPGEVHEKKGKRIKVNEEEYHSLKEKSKRTDELLDQLLRLQAEFENTRKRYLKEKEDYVRFAHGAIVQELLPVYDHFVIALSNIQALPDGGGNHSVILQGVQMIQGEMWELLSRNGLSKIATVGKIFDPEQHEAITTVEDATHPEGTVIEEIRPGYLLNGKLLRPASVKICKIKK